MFKTAKQWMSEIMLACSVIPHIFYNCTTLTENHVAELTVFTVHLEDITTPKHEAPRRKCKWYKSMEIRF